MKFFIKVQQTRGNGSAYDVLYVDMTAEKIMEVQRLRSLARSHNLSEVRVFDCQPTLFSLAQLAQQPDIAFTDQAQLSTIMRRAQESFAKGCYWSRPGEDFVLPALLEVERPDVTMELVAFPDGFCWQMRHRDGEEWQSKGINLAYLAEALQQQLSATKRITVQLVAQTRMTWDGTVLVPVIWDDEKIKEFMQESLGDQVIGEYVEDVDYWERGTCTFKHVEPGTDDSEPDFIVTADDRVMRVCTRPGAPE